MNMRTVATMVAAVWAAVPAGAVDVAAIKARGSLRLISFPFPDNEFVHRDGDGWSGVDVDIATAFAKTLGVTVEVIPKNGYGELIPALQAGEGDLVGSSFSITPARSEVVDFSKPYFPSIVQVVVKSSSSISTTADLAKGSAATVPGSSLDERLALFKPTRRVAVDNSAAQFAAVAEGRADYALADSTSVLSDLPDHPTLKVAINLPGVTHYGFAFRRDSPELLAAFDQHLQRIREAGYLYQLVRRHFGEKGVELFEIAKE